MPARDIDIIEDLLKCCASISETALSYRTLSASQEIDDSTLTTSCIATEEELACWLDHRLLDYKAHLQQQQSALAGKPGKSELRREVQSQKHELFDETLRQHIEKILLKRITLSNVMENICSQDRREKNDPPAESTEMLKESQDLRTRQASNALKLSDQVDHVRSQIRKESKEFELLRSKNSALRQKLKGRLESQTVQDCSELSQKNVVLKRVIFDLMAGTELDWTNDDRLEEVLSRVSPEE